MRTLCFLLLMLLASCTAIPTPDGYAVAIGGKGGFKRDAAGNIAAMWSNDKSFQSATMAASAIAGLAYSASNLAAQEVTKQVATKQATKQAINASNNAAAVEMAKTQAGVITATTIPK